MSSSWEAAHYPHLWEVLSGCFSSSSILSVACHVLPSEPPVAPRTQLQARCRSEKLLGCCLKLAGQQQPTWPLGSGDILWGSD